MKFQPLPALFRSFAALGVLLIAVVMPQVSAAQEGNLDKSQPKGITVDEIIKRFSTKEKEFKIARDQYTFRQDVKVMTLDGDTRMAQNITRFSMCPSTIRDARSRTSYSPLRPHCNAS